MELEILNQEIITELIQDVIARHQVSYPDLIKKQNDILAVIQNETQNFSKSLKKGLNHFNKLISNNKKIISGKEAFYLFQSFGFPLEMIKEIASEKKIKVDESGFQNEYLKHKEISRAKVA
jgi:alanyl-tRNA synthetase